MNARLPDDAATVLSLERLVIGSILTSCPKTLPRLLPADFALEKNRTLWTAILHIHAEAGALDLPILRQFLAANGLLDEAGGDAYLASCVEEGVAAVNVDAYAAQIRQSARRRGTVDIIATSHDADPEEVIAKLGKLAPRLGPRGASSAVLQNMSDVVSEDVRWIWTRRVAAGKLNLIVGNAGLGKSMATLDMASRITKGIPFPGETEALPVGNVIVLSAEDASGDTIRPRLDAHGADVSRVDRLRAVRDHKGHERPFSLKRDLEALERAIVEKKAALVVIDPLSAYLGEGTNPYQDNEVRGLLTPLAEMAERTGCAILGIMHLTKATDRPTILRVPASIAFAGAARSILAVSEHPDDPAQRILLSIKLNVGAAPEKLAFGMAEGAIKWLGHTDVSVDLSVSKKADSFALRKAVAFLEEIFKDVAPGGMVPSKQVEAEALEMGVSATSLDRAKKRLRIEARRIGGSRGVWQLVKGPGDSETTPLENSLIPLISSVPLQVDEVKGSDRPKNPKESLTGEPGEGTKGALIVTVESAHRDRLLAVLDRPLQAPIGPCTFIGCPVHDPKPLSLDPDDAVNDLEPETET